MSLLAQAIETRLMDLVAVLDEFDPPQSIRQDLSGGRALARETLGVSSCALLHLAVRVLPANTAFAIPHSPAFVIFALIDVWWAG